MPCRFGRRAVLRLLNTQTWDCDYPVHLSPGPWLFWYLSRVSLCRRSYFLRHTERRLATHQCVSRHNLRKGGRLYWNWMHSYVSGAGSVSVVGVVSLKTRCYYVVIIYTFWLNIDADPVGEYNMFTVWTLVRVYSECKWLIYKPRPSNSTPKRRVQNEYIKLTIIKLGFVSYVHS